MGGGLLQIAAYGAQDVYLTGDPQITFFKVVYRRHTNFSMEAIQQHFSGKIGFGKSDISTTISRNGDLINSMYLQVTLPPAPNGWTWIDSVGHRLIKSIRINLGGDTIDEHNGRWLEIWDQLTHDATSKDAYSQMTGKQGIFGYHDGGEQLTVRWPGRWLAACRWPSCSLARWPTAAFDLMSDMHACMGSGMMFSFPGIFYDI